MANSLLDELQNDFNLERETHNKEVEELKKVILQLNPQYEFNQSSQQVELSNFGEILNLVSEVKEIDEDFESNSNTTKKEGEENPTKSDATIIGAIELLHKKMDLERRAHKEEVELLQEIIYKLTNEKEASNTEQCECDKMRQLVQEAKILQNSEK